MRIAGQIPHPYFTITVFHMNAKYLIKFEAGPFEQTYKFSEEDYKGFDRIKTLVDEQFLNDVTARFNEMALALRGTMGRNK
jgi:hypothetical protein